MTCVDGRAYIAAAKRKDRSRAGKIESAKKSSEAHYETHGRFFYLTEENILAPGAFEELEEEEQVLDPELILPDGITRQFALEDLRAKSVLLSFDHQPNAPSLGTNEVTSPEWVNGGSSSVRFDYPVFGATTGGNSMQVSPTIVSPTDLSLQSNNALDSSSEELDFGLYLKDPDEITDVDNSQDLTQAEHDETHFSQSSFLDEALDPQNRWTDYMMNLEGLGSSDHHHIWAKEEQPE